MAPEFGSRRNSEIVIVKFGGSSLADLSRIRCIARQVAAIHQAGHRVVAVVSAMGTTTDRLVGMAGELATDPAARELDLIMSTGETLSAGLTALALGELGVAAHALTGAQAGIRTDETFGAARVLDVRPNRVVQLLDDVGVVVVAGFQGATARDDVATLGRGGSDATAVMLAAALGSQRCEIRSDVDGVYTADPALVPGARKLPRLGYQDMLRMARSGARVLQPLAARLSHDLRVPLHIRSSFTDEEGTRIGLAGRAPQSAAVLAVVHRVEPAGFDSACRPEPGRDLGRIAVLANTTAAEVLPARALATLAGHGIPVLMSQPRLDCFTVFVDSADLYDAVRVLHEHLIDDIQPSLANHA